MTKNILFTSLNMAGADHAIHYCVCQEGVRRLYSDMMLSIEPAVKYILSSVPIEAILVLERNIPADADPQKESMSIDEGRAFYSSDPGSLSPAHLFQYRLSQFKDGLQLNQKAIYEFLPEEERNQAESFLHRFYERQETGNEPGKFNRFFDRAVKDPKVFEELKTEFFRTFPNAENNRRKYIAWIWNYLYMNLKESSRLEMLEENETAKVYFIPEIVDKEGGFPADSLLNLADGFTSQNSEDIGIYVAMGNDDMTDNFIMLGVLDILDTILGSSVNVERAVTCTDAASRPAGVIQTNDRFYGILSLVNAERTFLRYGKADLIVDCWEHSGSKNKQVEKMVYAMRRIDTGLSLCSVADLEQGISELRNIFRQGFNLSESDYSSKFFILMAEGIRKDYGRMVTSEDSGVIDRVKWAYRKGFYQQCLTLIEAKAPADIVGRGIFCYCTDPSEKQRITELFARRHSSLRTTEYYLMFDIDNYFVKYNVMFRYPPTSNVNQRLDAKDILSSLDNHDPDFITPQTVCEDRQALEDLLFAYLHVNRIRNKTNHAQDNAEETELLFPDLKAESSKLAEIRESIEYYIECYDRVIDLIKDRKPTVVKITYDEVKAVADQLKRQDAERTAADG